jgi:lysophospholipase L1-like esterase
MALVYLGVRMKSSPESSRRVFEFVGKSVFGAFVVFAVLELVFWSAFSFGHWLRPDPRRADLSPAYAGATWVPEFYREQSLRLQSRYGYVPFRVVGVNSWHSKYFNNDEHPSGIWRRTVNPEGQCEKQPKISVWVFGGSTVYGTGVPDWDTLPSYLSRRLNSDGHACVVVTNFGEESYVTMQELILLVEQLKRGGNPNIVIFYDGFNDANVGTRSADPWTAYDNLEVIQPRAEGTIWGRFDFVRHLYTVRVVAAARKLFQGHDASLSPDQLSAKAVTVVDNYEANLNIACALGKSYNFKFYGFWQPMLFYGHKPLVPFEQQLVQFDTAHSTRWVASPAVAAYREAERRAPNAVYFYMAGVFDSVPDPVYLDEAHLGPHGNELVANAIAKYVEDHPAGMEFRQDKGQ